MTDIITLQAAPPPGTTCQEATNLSTQYHIPCGQPAEFYVKTSGPEPVPMCRRCAERTVTEHRGRFVTVDAPDQPWDAAS